MHEIQFYPETDKNATLINAIQSFTNLTNNLIISDFSHLNNFDSEFGLRLSHNGVDWVSNSHTLRFEMYRTERSIWFWHIPWHILYTTLTLPINTRWDKLIVGQEETWLIASTSFTWKTLNWKWSKTIKRFYGRFSFNRNNLNYRQHENIIRG